MDIKQINKYFTSQPTIEQLERMAELVLKAGTLVQEMDNMPAPVNSVKDIVKYDIQRRQNKRLLEEHRYIYDQMADCYVMSPEEFAVWQYQNGIFPKQIRPFTPKPVLGDELDKELDAEMTKELGLN